jgi:hypothetical protein
MDVGLPSGVPNHALFLIPYHDDLRYWKLQC